MGIAVLVPDVNESDLRLLGARRPRRRQRGRDPVRAVRGPQRRRGRGGDRSSPPARRAARSPTSTTSATASTRRCSTSARIESLVKAGGFDSLGHPRQGLVLVLRDDHRHRARPSPQRGRGPVRPLLGRRTSPTSEAVVGHRTEIPDTEFPKAQRLAFEKEMLGLYVSDHPTDGRRASAAAATSTARSPSCARAVRARCARSAASSPRSTASTRSAATSWPPSCSRISAAAVEVMVFPRDDGAVRPPARGRRHRRGQGPARHPRRHAQDHRDGGRAARAHRSTAARPCASR